MKFIQIHNYPVTFNVKTDDYLQHTSWNWFGFIFELIIIYVFLWLLLFVFNFLLHLYLSIGSMMALWVAFGSPQFDPELRLLSMWSVECSLLAHGYLWVLWFPPTSPKIYISSLTGYSKLPLSVNECVNVGVVPGDGLMSLPECIKPSHSVFQIQTRLKHWRLMYEWMINPMNE